jgi:hypothetical protein
MMGWLVSAVSLVGSFLFLPVASVTSLPGLVESTRSAIAQPSDERFASELAVMVQPASGSRLERLRRLLPYGMTHDTVLRFLTETDPVLARSVPSQEDQDFLQ